MYILGIETSCDETSIAILKNYNVLSNVTISSLKEHKIYGGIVPEIASRHHLKNIDRVTNLVLQNTKVKLKDIGLICATFKPGLINALAVGLSFAQGLALSLKKPFVGVNHLYAHLFSPFLNRKERLRFPFLGVVVSGGHTDFYSVEDFTHISLIGGTIDDACGETFDKVARSLNLGYPGGPIIDRLFREEYKDSFLFKCGRKGLNLSFSGIKTAVIYKRIELEKNKSLDYQTKIKLLSSFQAQVVETLIETILYAARENNFKHIVCGGGVFANRYLRKLLLKKVSKIKVSLSPLEYATDNASMVAGLGFYLYNKGVRSSFKLQPEAN